MIALVLVCVGIGAIAAVLTYALVAGPEPRPDAPSGRHGPP